MGTAMKVAIIGYGRIGRVHAAAVRAEPDLERLAICDPAVATPEAGVIATGTAIYGDVDAMLTSLRPDVVHVCTPPTTHASIAARALRAGARVYVEKPMALTTEECGRLSSALRTEPAALCVGHNFLFEPEVLLARRWVAEGRIGRVVSVDAFYAVDTLVGVSGPGAWSGALPGGRFTDLLPHPIYLTTAFLGAVRGVSARWRGAGGDADPTELGAVLECERGVGLIHVSLATVPWELGITLRGTLGTVRVDLARQRAVLVRPGRGPRRFAAVATAASVAAQTARGSVRRLSGKLTGSLRGYPGIRALVARFYASLRDGLPPPVTFADGAAVVSVLERMRLQLAARREPGRRAELQVRRHA
jgi:predicted dehydrogenase